MVIRPLWRLPVGPDGEIRRWAVRLALTRAEYEALRSAAKYRKLPMTATARWIVVSALESAGLLGKVEPPAADLPGVRAGSETDLGGKG